MADNQSIFGNLVYAHSSQADWEQTDELAFDYIKNKPTNLATTDYVAEQLSNMNAATGTENGLMESTDKTKLDSYEPQAIMISTSTTDLPEVVDGAILIAYDAWVLRQQPAHLWLDIVAIMVDVQYKLTLVLLILIFMLEVQ